MVGVFCEVNHLSKQNKNYTICFTLVALHIGLHLIRTEHFSTALFRVATILVFYMQNQDDCLVPKSAAERRPALTKRRPLLAEITVAVCSDIA